jgi:hypothetical protein
MLGLKGRLFLKINCKEIWQQVFICLRPPPLREGVEVSGGEPVRRLEGSVSHFQEKEKRGEMITKNDNIK